MLLLLPYLPYDVQLIIFRDLHLMNMLEVMSELKKEMSDMTYILSYLQTRAFYPYQIRFKIFKMYNKDDNCMYCKNKVYRYIHYKLLTRCFEKIIKNQHIVFNDDDDIVLA
jgi:hypothetical protein